MDSLGHPMCALDKHPTYCIQPSCWYPSPLSETVMDWICISASRTMRRLRRSARHAAGALSNSTWKSPCSGLSLFQRSNARMKGSAASTAARVSFALWMGSMHLLAESRWTFWGTPAPACQRHNPSAGMRRRPKSWTGILIWTGPISSNQKIRSVSTIE